MGKKTNAKKKKNKTNKRRFFFPLSAFNTKKMFMFSLVEVFMYNALLKNPLSMPLVTREE